MQVRESSRTKMTGGCYATVERNDLSSNPAWAASPGPSREPDESPPPQARARRETLGQGAPEILRPRAAQSSGPPFPYPTIPARLDHARIEAEFSRRRRPCLPLGSGLEGTTFALPMPPPNITGRLHLGHALDLGLQDAALRRARSLGARTIWIPGCDHAGQSSHDKLMEAIPTLRWSTEAERRRYWRKAWARAESMKAGIMGQFGALGPLADLSNPRFTIDGEQRREAEDAIRALTLMGRISREGGRLMLDLRSEARELAAAIRSGEMRIEPGAHAGRLLAMLGEERLWEIGRDFPWGARAQLAFDEEGRATGGGSESWTLDTWFTSALWPSAGLGGAERFEALIIGYDIAYFWGARMAMMARALGRPWPFARMMLHGLIRDEQGRKFSKSLGNGIDPLKIIGEAGADALRMWCCSKAAWGADFKWSSQGIEAATRWLTKIANATRLLQMRAPPGARAVEQPLAWPEAFEERGARFEREMGADMDALRLDQAELRLRAFGRETWCEGYLGPASKAWEGSPEAWAQALGGHRRLLALAHPFAPASTWWLDRELRRRPAGM